MEKSRIEPSRIGKTMDALIQVSQLYPGARAHPAEMVSGDLSGYLASSRRRLDVIVKILTEHGWQADLMPFRITAKDNQKLDGCNAYFWKGNQFQKRVWFSAHSDHCAGVGAVDNASGLSIVAELGATLASTDDAGNLGFSIFDMEEATRVGSKKALVDGQFFPGSCAAVVNVDSVGYGSDAVFLDSTEEPHHLRKLTVSLRRIIYACFESAGQHISRLTYDDGSADHASFLHHGIPAVTIMTINRRAYERYRAIAAKDPHARTSSGREDWEEASVANSFRDCRCNCSIEQIATVASCLQASVKDLIGQHC